MSYAHRFSNLRMDPFERARQEDAMGYQRWYVEHMFAIAPASAYVGQWLQSFKEFPPRQKPGSFNLDPCYGGSDGRFLRQPIAPDSLALWVNI
jgi:hypothetical protein